MRRRVLTLLLVPLLIGLAAPPAHAEAPCEDLLGEFVCAVYEGTLNTADGVSKTAAVPQRMMRLPNAAEAYNTVTARKDGGPYSGCWGDSSGLIHQSETTRDLVYAVSLTYCYSYEQALVVSGRMWFWSNHFGPTEGPWKYDNTQSWNSKKHRWEVRVVLEAPCPSKGAEWTYATRVHHSVHFSDGRRGYAETGQPATVIDCTKYPR